MATERQSLCGDSFAFALAMRGPPGIDPNDRRIVVGALFRLQTGAKERIPFGVHARRPAA